MEGHYAVRQRAELEEINKKLSDENKVLRKRILELEATLRSLPPKDDRNPRI
tara:strand:- start:439 stop:594 length:156 start_codon:yes stop_codon:yes gene_type:complete